MYSLIGCLILFTSVSVSLFLGVCRPLKAYWDVGVDGVCLSNHRVESVVLAQGSGLFSDPLPSDAANCVSSLRHHRSYMCCIPDLLSQESPGQTTSKGGIMPFDGSGRYVGTLLDMTHDDLY